MHSTSKRTERVNVQLQVYSISLHPRRRTPARGRFTAQLAAASQCCWVQVGTKLKRTVRLRLRTIGTSWILTQPSGFALSPALCGLVEAGPGGAGPPSLPGRRFGPSGEPHGAHTKAHLLFRASAAALLLQSAKL